jgi:ribonuclease HI
MKRFPASPVRLASVLSALFMLSACEQREDRTQRAKLDVAEFISIAQRSQLPWPRRDGKGQSDLLMSIGDITGGGVSTTMLSTPSKRVLLSAWMRTGDEVAFEYEAQWYRLSLTQLDNQLIGTDYARFALRPSAQGSALAAAEQPETSAESVPQVTGGQSAQATNAKMEIDALIDGLSKLDAQFIRNGESHSAREAAEHLRRKLKRAGITPEQLTAELFIEKLATGSSMTGEPYQIEWPDGHREAAADYLRGELHKLRGQ